MFINVIDILGIYEVNFFNDNLYILNTNKDFPSKAKSTQDNLNFP